MRDVSPQFIEAVFSQETSDAFIALLTFYIPNQAEPLRVSSDPTVTLPINGVPGTVSNGDEFIFLPFDIKLPQSDESGVTSARLTIENIDRRIVQAVRSAGSDISVKLEIVLSSNLDYVEYSIENFQLTSVSYNALNVQGDISMEYLGLEPWPSARFTPSYFPAMF